MGIRAKLVLCLLAVLIPLVAVSLFTINLLDQQLIDRTEASLSNTQRLEAARINEVLATYAQDARNLASGSQVKQFVEACNAFREALRNGTDQADIQNMLSTTVGGIDGFAIVDRRAPWPLQQLTLALQRQAGIMGSNVTELRIVDAAGEILGETIGYTWKPASDGLLKRSIATVKTTFGDAFVNTDGEHHLGMVSPIISDSGEVVGALLLETRLDPITDLVAKHEGVGRSSEAHIAQPTADGSAQLITSLRFDRTAAFNKIIPESTNLPVNQALHSLRSRILHSKDYRGVDSILAIQTIPATGWGLVVKLDASEAYEPAQELRRVLIITTVSSVIFVLVCYIFCLVPIANRLQRTATAARKIMNGDLTTRITDNAQDEVGHLARTIDTLARDLEADQHMRESVEARLRHQALHDELTGLLNRKYANSVIQQLNKDARSQHSVMFIDLNGFKDVNDLYGHATGDEVLVVVAERLSKQIASTEGITLARWGGDEFVVILPHCDEETATDFALKLHNAFDNAVATSAGMHYISCSIGLATSSESKSLDEVLLEADILMYEQKKRQKKPRSKGSMAIRTVERALHEDRVEVWFQPIVSLLQPGNYEMSGAESLVRIRSRDGGIILPEEFLADVDNSELGAELDRRILCRAMTSLARWRAAGVVGENFRLSLNMTTQSLNDPAFSAILNHQMQASSVSPKNIVIEMPHYIKIDPLMVSHLRMLGVTVALDKIGADAASLGRSSRLQPDIVKIDRRWLGDAIVAPHMVSICQELGLELIVEGIETREQMAELHELGVSRFQGYLFDSPQRPVDFISRWGESTLEGLGVRLNRNVALRLVG